MRNFILSLFTGDLLLGLIAIFIAFSLAFATLDAAALFTTMNLSKAAIFILVMLFSSFVAEVYRYDKQMDQQKTAARIIFSLSLSFFTLAAVDMFFPNLTFDQRVIIISLFFYGVFQFIWHIVYTTWDRMSGFSKRVLILGTGPLAQQMGELIATPNRQHALLGYFDCSDNPVLVPKGKVLGNGKGLAEIVRKLKAHKVVVSLKERRGIFPLEDILSCKLSGVEVVDAPSFYEEMTGKLLLEDINPSWFIFSDGFRVTTFRKLIKRMLDVCCSLLGLALVSPLLPLIALLIRLDSRGPVFFKQTRVGEGGKDFVIMKFRTMREDAEANGAVWAEEEDPRITRVGKWLRKTRLDEVPQLFNVLGGTMSFVGPRPERPEFVQMLKEVIPYYGERHYVKPGITGWAQVSYPYGSSVEDAIEKLRYDLYYIKNLSITFDILIILKTIHVVLFGKGGR
ncbi:MAG: TIGR03013 family XrtA/PEP-CTERM system glycosyltransferase [Desulfovibrionales bacterium]